MSGSTHGRPLVRRVVQEHRRVLMPLLVAFGVNVLVYAFVVYPLSDRVANVAQREQTAEAELQAARREHGQASGALTGKARASAELATFYDDVLPQGLTGARRLTYLRLAQLARQSNLHLQSSRTADRLERGSTLAQLTIQMQLSGSWDDIRGFLYELETAPEFVVVDNVELAEGNESGLLSLNLNLSTYYRDVPQ